MITKLLVCLSVCAATLFAQADSTTGEDTGTADENLLEQSSEDSPIIDVLIPEVQPQNSSPSVFLRSRLVQKLQQPKGYRNGSYLGSSLKSYQRMTVTISGKVTGGILLAKDAGEQRLNEFTSWNLSVTESGVIRKAVIGSYRVESGQGIALWRGYDFSKGADVITPAGRRPRGVVSSLSADEAEYFMGAATEISLGPVTGTVMYSRRSLSASTDTLGNVTSLYNSGYFRTEGERAKRDNLSERLFGAHLAYHASGRQSIGLTYYHTHLSSPLSFDGGKRFAGDRYALVAMEYNLGFESVTLFGEWASVNASVGGMSGVRLDPGDGVTMIVSVRSYPYRFVSLHGLGFGEGSSTSNEIGAYIGMTLRPAKPLSLSLYYDQFNFPEKTSISRFSTHGNDFLSEIRISLPKTCTVTFRYQRRISDGSNEMSPADVQRLQRTRLEVEYEVSRAVRLRTRAERVSLDWKASSQAEQGMMLYQDIGVHPGTALWWNIRLTFFTTDSYATRVYAYERDLDGVLSLPALYGSGIRWYGLVRYSLSDKIDLSVKYSDLIRDDVKHLGSGLDELPSNHDDRVGVQLDARF